MRNKIPDSEKKISVTATIDSKINDLLEKWMKENGYDNKSKVIEHLILKQIEKNNED